jgi:hypothetical protein
MNCTSDASPQNADVPIDSMLLKYASTLLIDVQFLNAASPMFLIRSTGYGTVLRLVQPSNACSAMLDSLQLALKETNDEHPKNADGDISLAAFICAFSSSPLYANILSAIDINLLATTIYRFGKLDNAPPPTIRVSFKSKYVHACA